MTHYIYDTTDSSWYSLDSGGLLEKIDPMDMDPAETTWLAGPDCQIHKAPMPIKQAKQAAKAIPFAIEDSLGSELDSNHIHYLGREGGIGYAATVSHQVMESIQQFGVKQIYPLLIAEFDKTQGKSQVNVLHFNGMCYIKTGSFESYAVPESLLVLSLEKLLAKTDSIDICIFEVSPLNDLVKANLENLTDKVQYKPSSGLPTPNATSGLLSGLYKVVEPKKKKQPSRFKALYALAAILAVVILGERYIKAQQYYALAEATNNASVEYFKQLFPGERPRVKGLKRQFDELAGTQSKNQSGVTFTKLFSVTAKQIKNDSKLEITSVRFNDKNGLIEYSINADSISQLEGLKAALEKQNISTEIASANQSGGKIKGLIKVSSNV